MFFILPVSISDQLLPVSMVDQMVPIPLLCLVAMTITLTLGNVSLILEKVLCDFVFEFLKIFCLLPHYQGEKKPITLF